MSQKYSDGETAAGCGCLVISFLLFSILFGVGLGIGQALIS